MIQNGKCILITSALNSCHFITLFDWKIMVVLHNKDKIQGAGLCQAQVKLGYPASLG
jgi:hypothetical protein